MIDPRIISVTVPIYGEPDPDTGERAITGYVSGAHYNAPRTLAVTADGPVLLPAALAAYEVDPEPSTPVMLFAGDALVDGRWRDTAMLRFDDEAAALAAFEAAGLTLAAPAGE